MLNETEKQSYRDKGYLVLPGFHSQAAITSLRQRALEIVEQFDPAEGISIFSTQDKKAAADRYFLDSAHRISCFFEEEAFDAQGRLGQSKHLSINKIGHALHRLDPVFRAFSTEARIGSLAHDLGLMQPEIRQSMYIFKQPGIGGEVAWHQDATFFDTKPISVTTFWFALEEATRDNGCLWVVPGSHHRPLCQRFVKRGDKTTMTTDDDTPWPTLAESVPLEVPSGTLVIFHGLLPHYSAPNRSANSRHAYTLHITDATAVYSPDNWIQAMPDEAPLPWGSGE